MKHHRKRLAASLMLSLLFLTAFCGTSFAAEPDAPEVSYNPTIIDPAPVYPAYPAEIKVRQENDIYYLEKIYYMSVRDDPSLIPREPFDREGRHYMPDNADLNFSVFMDCEFAVCRIHGALFDGTSIFSSQIHNADIDHTTFFHAAIANTHFHDTTLTLVSFQKAHIVRCNTIDCTLDRVSYLNATLDGCSFGRVAATGTEGLLTAHITQGGATQEECDYNRKAIYRALSPPPSETRKPEQKRGGR